MCICCYIFRATKHKAKFLTQQETGNITPLLSTNGIQYGNLSTVVILSKKHLSRCSLLVEDDIRLEPLALCRALAAEAKSMGNNRIVDILISRINIQGYEFTNDAV
jgi:hypothetical protein